MPLRKPHRTGFTEPGLDADDPALKAYFINEKKPDQIHTDPTINQCGELICHNCGRRGNAHVWFPPYRCKDASEVILKTTFEAWIDLAP